MPSNTINALVNPLAFLEVDAPWADELRQITVGPEQVLRFLCNPGEPREVGDLVARYKKVSVEEPRLFAAPAEARLLERLIWPLRQAKGNFMLGHFLGTVSLCGMVAEMAAILTFDLGKVQINGKAMNESKQKSLFGASFEKQGQERRVEILAGYGLITTELKQSYDTVRVARRRYLHLWSANHEALEADAIACFKAAVKVVVATLGLSVADGKLILKPEVFEYLALHNAGPNAVAGDG